MATSSKAAQRDSFVTRIVVMVDDATEPGITDEEATRHRTAIVNILLNRNNDLPHRLPSISPGQAVSFAIRKRLKSEDEAAVLNTLVLLDEFMRTVPFFYRYVANDKFFRRLWRFVVPDYKNQMKSIIPIFGRPKAHLTSRGPDSEVSSRVMILIRAWAEELSIMFHGRQDQDAGFLIERFRDKRTRVTFPEVPKTPKPWVCPVPSQATARPFGSMRGAAASASSSSAVPANMTLDEVENTSKLFATLVDNATTVDELNEDVCADLAHRCQQFSDNFTRMIDNLKEEDDLPRAVAVSEILQRSLVRYNAGLEGGQLQGANNAPIEIVSLDSDEEPYDQPSDRNLQLATQSIRRLSLQSDDRRSSDRSRPDVPRVALKDRAAVRKDDDDRDHTRSRKLDRSRDYDRARDVDRSRDADRAQDYDRDHERQRDSRDSRDSRDRGKRERDHRERDHRERAARDPGRSRNWERTRDRDNEEKRDRSYQSRDRTYEEDDVSSDSSDEIRPSRAADAKTDAAPIDKRTRKSMAESKGSFSRRETSDAEARSYGRSRGTTRKTSERRRNTDNLIDVPEGDDDVETDEEDLRKNGERNDESFAMLAERYESKKGRVGKVKGASKASSKSGSRTGVSRGQGAPSDSGNGTGGGATGAAPVAAGMPGAPAMMGMQQPGGGGMDASNMYQSGVSNFGMNPMMMMPNPYAMYGSVNPMGMQGMQDPMAMYNAYATVNPAMYYQSMNAGIFPPMMAPMAGAGAAPIVPNGAGQSMASGGANAAPVDGGNGDSNAAGGGGPGAGHEAEGQVDAAGGGAMMGNMAGNGGAMSAMGAVPMAGHGSSVNGAGVTLSKEEAESHAAAYQTAMQQAATAYHMAASAYKTMQGQAAIAQTHTQTQMQTVTQTAMDDAGGASGASADMAVVPGGVMAGASDEQAPGQAEGHRQ